ncbi:MAG TPA: phage holin family protein [Candidatus Methylomirabilis sp.]|nr:phage holin family protein [Candidatus Methylomirabilis sp.]
MDSPETPPLHSVPILDLLRQVLRTGTQLVEKDIELARAELEADLRAQVRMAGRMAAAALLVLLAINLFLVALVLALARLMPGWLAALALAVLLLAAGAAFGWAAWRGRSGAPLAATRRKVKEDLEWAKERLT